MARYKTYDYDQTHLIPVCLEAQFLEGSLEHAIHILVENKMDLSLFESRYKNDETGCKAYDPKILLKIVLFAYSRGVIGSRRIEWLCRKHVTCMALACMQCPDHSTIAAFVSSMHHEVLSVFRDILLVCEEQQLLGGTVFALDGLKLSSNASKQWSGTMDELKHKQEKLEAKIQELVKAHQEADASHQEADATLLPLVSDVSGTGFDADTVNSSEHLESGKGAITEPQCDELQDGKCPSEAEGWDHSTEAGCRPPDGPCGNGETGRTTGKDKTSSGKSSGSRKKKGCNTQRRKQTKSKKQKRAERLKRVRRHAERLKNWLVSHDKKIGRQGNEIKSNITDNESAKMSTSHGVIQGYNAQAVVDDKHQVIVAAEVFGDGQDGQHLSVVMPQLKDNMETIGHGEGYLAGKQFLADSNYFSDNNLKTCEEEELDAYIPDCNFRKRDPRFADQNRYKPNKKKNKRTRFVVEDFTYDEATQGYRCPHGKLLHLHAREHRVRHRVYRYYVADEKDCRDCPFRKKCLSQNKTKRKHLGIPVAEPETKPKSRCQQMIEKIDTPEGKKQYSQRLAIVEPVFANIRTQKGLDHVTLRGKAKVDIQWILYAMVHNIEKIANYGEVA